MKAYSRLDNYLIERNAIVQRVEDKIQVQFLDQDNKPDTKNFEPNYSEFIDLADILEI